MNSGSSFLSNFIRIWIQEFLLFFIFLAILKTIKKCILKNKIIYINNIREIIQPEELKENMTSFYLQIYQKKSILWKFDTFKIINSLMNEISSDEESINKSLGEK